jgi:hypothetical protein
MEGDVENVAGDWEGGGGGVGGWRRGRGGGRMEGDWEAKKGWQGKWSIESPVERGVSSVQAEREGRARDMSRREEEIEEGMGIGEWGGMITISE